MPEQVRRAVGRAVARRAVRASTYDAEAHTVELVAATDAMIRVPGWNIGIDSDYYEILDMSPGAVDLTQVAAGNCPLLADHNHWSLEDRLGAIVSGRLESGQLITVAEFGRSPAAQNIEAEMGTTTPPPCSAGYRLDELVLQGFHDDGLPIYRATKWRLREVSFVPIAADPNAGVRADQDGSHPCVIIEESRTMPPENEPAVPAGAAATPAAEATRAEPAASAVPAVVTPAASAARALTAAELLTVQSSARAVGVELTAAELTRAAVDPVAEVNALILHRAPSARPRTRWPPARRRAPAKSTPASAPRSSACSWPASAAPLPRRLRRASADTASPTSSVCAPGLRSRDPHEILQRAMHTTSDFPLLLEAARTRRCSRRTKPPRPPIAPGPRSGGSPTSRPTSSCASANSPTWSMSARAAKSSRARSPRAASPSRPARRGGSSPCRAR
jgi:hypothetical protein